MKPFYSIIYLKPESVSDEKIAVGLLLSVNNKPMFNFSENKLKVASRMIDSDAVESIRKMLHNIRQKINSMNSGDGQTEAFEIKLFSESYFEYLSRYSNNLVLYSKPSENIGEYELSDFSSLFKLMIDKDFGKVEEKIVSFRKTVINTLKISSIANKVDVQYLIPKAKVKYLLSDSKIDYIGVNGSIISGNSVDTHTEPYTLEMNIYKIRVLTDGLLNLAKTLDFSNEGRHILFYNEPESIKQKEIIQSAKKDNTSFFKIKPWDEFEEEKYRIEECNVRKFSEVINNY